MTEQHSSFGTYTACDLWQHLFRDNRGHLQIFAGTRNGGRLINTREAYFNYPQDIEYAVEWASEKSEEGQEVYYCAHLLTRPERNKANAAEISALYADLDTAPLPNERLKPTAVVRTSTGNLQGYWRLTDSLPPVVAESINRRLTQATGADPSGYDLTQLLRVPATVNHKYEESPVVEVLEISDTAYTPGELDQILPEIEEARSNGKAAPVGDRIPAGERNSTMASLAGTMRRRRMGEAEILAALRVANEQRCDPPLEDKEVSKIAASVARYEPAGELVWASFGGRRIGDGPERFNLTDLGNAKRLIHHHGQNLRYCWLWGKWLVWHNTRWIKDDSGEVFRLAKETVANIYHEAAAAPDEDTRKALAKHAMRSESGARIKEMVDLARSDVPVMPDALDSSPDLLNVKNGTIDLRTGELREHRREDFITKIAPVEYRLDATAPAWEAFLERVLPSEELRGFVQRAAGYSATGDTSEQCMLINHGGGANGKSTYQEILALTLGDYATRTPTETLLTKRAGGIPNDVARLKGARFVAASETEEGRRLAESLVKDLTGQDTISARFMRAEWFDFKPTHKLWLSTNHKPEIRGTDNAIWRRIRLVPWSVTIPPAEQDRKLLQKLRDELPGILAWIVRGCLEWRRKGLQPPDEVRQATSAYRAEMDVLAGFLADCCVRGDSEHAYAGELWGAWKRWCEETGERPETQKKFGGRLKDRGFLNDRDSKTGRKVWFGVSLRDDWEARAGISLNHSTVSFAGKKQDAEPSEPKNDITSSDSMPRGVMCKKGSEGSDGSVETPLSNDVEPGQSAMLADLKEGRAAKDDARNCQHDTAGGCWMCKREIERLVSEGMSEKEATAAVLNQGGA